MSGSWVTITMVRPRERLSAPSRRISSWLRAESRLPVGSSASSTAGRVTSGACDGDALLLPARELAGQVALAALEADLGHDLAGQGAALGGRHAAVDQRQLDVLARAGAGHQVVALEHEAEVVAAQQRQLIAGQVGGVDAAEQVVPAARRVEAADDVEAGRLARAAGPHQGDELAGFDAEINVIEGDHGGVALAVDLADLLELDDGGGHQSPPLLSMMTRAPTGTGPVITVRVPSLAPARTVTARGCSASSR